MPQTIEKADYSGKTHWMTERFAPGEGKTACGKTMRENAVTGGSIAKLINCAKCKAKLREAGWKV